MAWRKAKSLVVLVDQINAAYPGRDKSSDGAIGDERHAIRGSDHNPWVKDGRTGVVTAVDIDEDLSASIHSLSAIVDAICASRDRRVKYIIYEGRITVKGSSLQQWKKYTGSNAHKHHAHISVFPEKKFYDDEALWSIEPIPTAPNPTPDAERFYVVVPGDTLWGLSRKFKTGVDALKTLNSLVSDIIQVGQTLRVK